MQTNHVLTRFELHTDEYLIGGHHTDKAKQEQLRQFFEDVHRSDREMLVGLAAMRWVPGKLELLSGALYTPRYRKAFLAGIRNRLANGISDSDAQQLVELLGHLSDDWPEIYASEIDTLLTRVAESHVSNAA